MATVTRPSINDRARLDWRLFGLLTAAGAIGAVAVLPLVFTLQREALEAAGVPLATLAVAQVVQTTFLVALAVIAGLTLGWRVGLDAPLLAQAVRARGWPDSRRAFVPPALVLGVAGALAVLLLDVVVFLPRIDGLDPVTAPLWQRLLASIYGGVTEELLLRFGLFSLLAFALSRLTGDRHGHLPAPMVLWTVNVVVAVLFGLAHLPATAALVDITAIVVTRAVILNGLLGLAFGYLYWSRGLEAAIVAHFAADIVLQLAAGLV